MITISMTEDQWEDLIDTCEVSIQELFPGCRGCEYREEGFCTRMEECMKENWNIVLRNLNAY